MDEASRIVFNPNDTLQKKIEDTISEYNHAWAKAYNTLDISYCLPYIKPVVNGVENKTISGLQRTLDNLRKSSNIREVSLSSISFQSAVFLPDDTISIEVTEVWSRKHNTSLGASIGYDPTYNGTYIFEQDSGSGKWLIKSINY